MATKNDLGNLELRMDTKMTSIRGDVEQVQLRLDSIDRALSGRVGLVETEVSRLRNVVYLLVKDKPDMPRLLGQSGLHENRPSSENRNNVVKMALRGHGLSRFHDVALAYEGVAKECHPHTTVYSIAANSSR